MRIRGFSSTVSVPITPPELPKSRVNDGEDPAGPTNDEATSEVTIRLAVSGGEDGRAAKRARREVAAFEFGLYAGALPPPPVCSCDLHFKPVLNSLPLSRLHL